MRCVAGQRMSCAALTLSWIFYYEKRYVNLADFQIERLRVTKKKIIETGNDSPTTTSIPTRIQQDDRISTAAALMNLFDIIFQRLA